MSNPRLRRVQKEIAECAKDKTSGIEVAMIDGNPFHLIGSFPGPEDSPYQGGIFDVDIAVPDQYPFQPMKMKFLTRVYHPNVSSATGAICLDILKDQWLPTLTLHSTLVSLQSLLCSPEPDDPQDAQVAGHFKRDRAGFDATAKEWTERYADPKNHARGELTDDQRIRQAGLEKEHVDKFANMGFPAKDVIRVLDRLNYRGSNVHNISNDAVVNSLLDA